MADPAPDDDDVTTDAPNDDAPLKRSDLDISAPSTRSRVILAVIAVFVIGVIVGRVSAGSDDTGEGDDAGEAATATSAAGLPFPSGDQDRSRYWGLASLLPVTTDAFDRADNPDGLGRAATGQQWNEIRGQWSVSERQAGVAPPRDGDGPVLAVTAGGEGDGLTEVTMPVVEGGAGLVFRYSDPENYWSVLADPEAGTWSVFKTFDGETELVSDVSASTANGVTISIVQDATRIRVLVEGLDVLLVNDDELSQHLQGGLIASPDSEGTARWDRFLVMKFNTPASG